MADFENMRLENFPNAGYILQFATFWKKGEKQIYIYITFIYIYIFYIHYSLVGQSKKKVLNLSCLSNRPK